ncbi:5'-nucleotidase, lipoprotein e(P4) family [Variovorax rhizosphaerae]|uniref:HAD family acid phosphatase n=1 Tax=Variovorax rhizosphaerae TaxID=1836200 RepID=A0ABU8WIV2_9BURK
MSHSFARAARHGAVALAFGAFSLAAHAQPAAAPTAPNTLGPTGQGVNNALLYAVAWKQTAAEYRALYYQGFNIARMHVERAIAARKPGDKPLAVVTDVDDTILLPLNYWGYLINNNLDFFDDPIWDKWIPENKVVAAPGAKEFLQFCADNKVEIHYVTSREQGEKTYDYAMGHLKFLGYPYADTQHLTVLRDTSNKEKRQDEIMKDFDVVVFLGDNLNDFRRKYYLKSNVDGRMAAMEADREKFGRNYILFPNPTDGHWLAAIFGDSEPPPTDANRELLKKASTRSAWKAKE